MNTVEKQRFEVSAELSSLKLHEEKMRAVRQYLKGLQWDGIERVPSLFPQCFGAADDEYHQQAAISFMANAAGRALHPGCVLESVLILSGAQGLGKSRGMQTLFGGNQWYRAAQRSPNESRFLMDLLGIWCVEIEETLSLLKGEADKVKRALTANADVYRYGYGGDSRLIPRQCVFVCTTNGTSGKIDSGGVRRFREVAVTRVELDKIASMRDQLWAEAVARLNHKGKGLGVL